MTARAPGGTGSGVPAGGTTGQVLKKNSNTDGDATWAADSTIPSGGTTGQVLAKNSNTNGDASWATPDVTQSELDTVSSSVTTVNSALTTHKTSGDHDSRYPRTVGTPVGGQTPVYDPVNGYYVPGTPKYDGKISSYNVSETSLRRWRAALSKAIISTTTPARILCLGDSITQGVASTPQYLNNWPYRLRQLLAADGRAGTVGEGVIIAGGQTLSLYDNRWTVGSGWNRVGGAIVNTMWQAAPGSGTLSLALPSCDRITIYYTRHGINGTWSYNVDGGGSTSVNANGATAIMTESISVSAGTHTLNIVPNPTTGYTMILAVEYHTSSAINDVEVITGGGYAGNTTASFMASANAFDTLPFLDFLSPDLTIICLGRNDANPANGVSTAQYIANMTTLINRMRVTNSKDVLIVTPPPSSLSMYTQNQAIMDACYTLADTLDVAVLDINKRFGAVWNTAPYSLSSDDIHPTDAGGHQIAQSVANLLLNV